MSETGLTKKYVCVFCKKSFTRQSWYDKHMCEKKKRFQEKNNVVVFKAHRLFSYWQRKQGLLKRGKEKSLDQFCSSPFYKAFVKLAEFGLQHYLVSSYRYLDWLVECNISQYEWYKEDNLELYRSWLLENENCIEQTQTTIQNIRSWAEENDIKPTDFWSKISPNKAYQMITLNRISPWVLFGYEPALEELMDRFEGEILFNLNDHINVKYWLRKIEDNPKQVEQMKQLMYGL